jgi:hypothetical protein
MAIEVGGAREGQSFVLKISLLMAYCVTQRRSLFNLH